MTQLTSWMFLALLHGAYWGLGGILIKTCLPESRLLSLGSPHWFSAWFLGLVPNVVLAFIANQFLGVRLGWAALLVPALLLLLLSACFVRWKQPPERAAAAVQAWTLAELALAAVVVFVWARRFAIAQPLADWDTFMYHLPFGEMVSRGEFPSKIGRSYILQMEAAYPPLFYFLYGLNALIRVPDVTYLAPRILLAAMNGLTCIATYHLANRSFKLNSLGSLVASLGTALILPATPSVQSVTALFFVLAVYYSWDVFRTGSITEPLPAHPLLLVTLLWSGCYWNSYLGLPLTGLFFLGLMLANLWCLYWEGRVPFGYRKIALAGIVIALLIGPHPLRNWLATGNPIYPAMASLLGGSDLTDWFLAHRGPAMRPMQQDWTFLPISLVLSRPLAQFLLAGMTAMFCRSSLRESERVLTLVILSGFFLIWFQVFHLEATPLNRFLYPITPLALAAVLSHVSRQWDKVGLPRAIVVSYLLGYTLLLVADRFPVPLVLASLPVLILAPSILTLLLENRDSEAAQFDPSVQEPVAASAGAMRPAWQNLLLIGTAAGLFALSTNWRHGNQYELPIEGDLRWMNENLTENDLVLLFDGRLFTFRHRYLALDDIRLEPFDQASTLVAALAELERLGVTHFYFSRDSANLVSESMSHKFNELLALPPGNPHAELVYESPPGFILKLRPDGE